MRCSLIDEIGEDYLVFDCVIKHDKWGISTFDIAGVLKISLPKVRKSLNSLRQRGWIEYSCAWYGQNMGYRRKYRLSEKARKKEDDR